MTAMDPIPETPPQMSDDRTNWRYYPTVTTLAGGKLYVTSGRDSLGTNVVEGEDRPLLFDPKKPANQQWTILPASADRVLHWYPFVFQATSGVFMGGGYYYHTDGNAQYPPDDTISRRTYIIDPLAVSPAWTHVGTSANPGGSACMYRPNKVMKAGAGHWLQYPTDCNCDRQRGVRDAYTIDLAAASPEWTTIQR